MSLFSLPRFFLHFRARKNRSQHRSIWLGGRLQWIEKKLKSITLRVYGQGKTLFVRQTFQQAFYKEFSNLQNQDLISIQLNVKKVVFKGPLVASVKEITGFKLLFRSNQSLNYLSHKKSTAPSLSLKKASCSQNSLFHPKIAEKWNDFIASIREYFNKRGLIEIQTPSLVRSPCIETNLHAFSLQFKWSSLKKKLFLPTSPEIHLKKLLCCDWTDIFEIRTCFRNEELSSIHEPEFWMLEWYRAFSGIKQIEKDLIDLLQYLKKKGLLCASLPPLKCVSLKSLFKKGVQLDLTPSTKVEELRKKAKELKIRVLETYDWNDLFDVLFITKVEPMLKKGAYIIYDFPPLPISLSRLNKKGWADRFEFYWDGLEIANAFDELNDLEEHKKRWKQASSFRKKNALQKIPSDQSFLNSLKEGMPPSGGIALGLDRLFLACQKLSRIQEIRAFSLRDQIPF